MYIVYKKISIPMYFSCTILEKKDKFIYFNKSKNFFFFFEIYKKQAKIIKNTNGLIIKNKHIELMQLLNFFEHLINTNIRSWVLHFYKKFKFKSKGLKIKRKLKKNLKFLFWLSHINIAHVTNCKLRRIGKQKYIFIASNWIYLQRICKSMRAVRPNNLFTKKGMRFSRQIITKKRGKKITYI